MSEEFKRRGVGESKMTGIFSSVSVFSETLFNTMSYLHTENGLSLFFQTCVTFLLPFGL